MIMRKLCGLFFFFCIDLLHGQYISEKKIIYSEIVKDSFELYISIPKELALNKSYDVVYYCDANLKSGKLLRQMINSKANDHQGHRIFVGIGHIGNFHVLRRRDFILPKIDNGDSIEAATIKYGQIEKFYQFLKIELIPAINTKYKTNKQENSIIGHSLAGLFVFYCLFKNEGVFKNYYALSPSLWVDNYSIYRFNKIIDNCLEVKYLYFSVGGLERINRIKQGANQMSRFLGTQNYQNLYYQYKIHKGKTHNTQVKISLEDILKRE